MVRFRFLSRRPEGLCPWAVGVMLATAGPAMAASSAVETLDAAVARELQAARMSGAIWLTSHANLSPESAAGAPRFLPNANDPSIRPVSGQTVVPPAPQPTEAQLEVMRQLEEMYQRDGRGPMPSLRMKDAPNTRLSKGQRVVAPEAAQTAEPAAVRPASSSSMTYQPTPLPPAPSASSSSSSQKPKRGFLSWFRRDTSPKPTRSTNQDEPSLFGKMFRPFRKDEPRPEPAAVSNVPPVPPPLPDFEPAPRYTAQPAPAPQAFRPAPARPLRASETFPPPAPPMTAATVPSAPPAAPADNPFGDEFQEDAFVSTPSVSHPLDDPFANVRDDVTPEIADAELDPDFIDSLEPANDGLAMPHSNAIAADDAFGDAKSDGPALGPDLPAEKPSPEARYAELQRKLAERAGLGGFQGFCPVALHDRRELVDARPEFISVYEGRTYELSSAEARVRFNANPEQYAPVNGGNDVVLTARGESEVEGNLHYAVWFKDRLYLFRSAESLDEFNADPRKYAIQN